MVMRDTPEAIRLAERLVAMHDLSEPEVMLELEAPSQAPPRHRSGIQFPQQVALPCCRLPLGAHPR